MGERFHSNLVVDAQPLLVKLLPFAQSLGVKYELRVLSHLVARLLSAVTPDVALELELWSEAFSRVRQMVVVIIHLSAR